MKLFYLLLLICSPVMAQNSGWGELGHAVGGGVKRDADEAYRERYMENIEAINALNEANAARDERYRVEAETAIKFQLVDSWKQIGLNDEEARGMASSFVFNDELRPHIERAKREGIKVTLDAAILAYRNRQYLLANQLLVAATRQSVTKP